MNAKKMSLYRDTLEKIRTELVGDVEKNLKSDQEDAGQGVADIADEATRNNTSLLRQNLGEQDWGKFKLVEEALEKIKAGDYGICGKCEKPIPEARLKVVPYAEYCVACKDEIEKEEETEKHNSNHFTPPMNPKGADPG